MYQLFAVSRPTDAGEKAFLEARDGGGAALFARLGRICSGKVVPFYRQRYGFRAGHTASRPDPAAIAFIVGLNSLAEIEQAFPGRLHAVLAGHFTAPTP